MADVELTNEEAHFRLELGLGSGACILVETSRGYGTLMQGIGDVANAQKELVCYALPA